MLTTFPTNPLLDLPPWVGQRSATFRFDLINGVSGEVLGSINPMRGATLSHRTQQTIKRTLSFTLGAADTAAVDLIQDRILLYMTFPNGEEYKLGRYMFTDSSRQVFTTGKLSNIVMNDEMYLVDQQLQVGFASVPVVDPINIPAATRGLNVERCIQRILDGVPITWHAEATPFESTSSWGAGARRGSVLEALSLSGDYFSPWFDNNGVLRFIRSFNPAQQVPDFDWDAGNQVLRTAIVENDDLLNAPNRFIVISNAPESRTTATYGAADVPVTAPHSIERRGFVIASVNDLQALTNAQCTAIAKNMVERQTVFETVKITTAPDPRHDSYNVIHWNGDLWLELDWVMPLSEGEPMQHTLRKAYR